MIPETGLPVDQIAYIDIEGDTSVLIPLYLPVVDGGTALKIRTIDAIDLSPDGQTAIFDGLAETILANGITLRGWSIFAVDLKTQNIVSLAGPFEDFNIGNPSFARTSSGRLLLETFSPEVSAIFAVDINQGTSAIVKSYDPPSDYFAYPRFSAADDFVVFTDEFYSLSSFDYQPRISRVALQSDHITPTGAVTVLQNLAINGLAYRRGVFAGAPVLSVSTPTPAIQGGASGSFRISRASGDQGIRLPLSFKTLGTARPGTDYTRLNLTAQLAPGVSFIDIPIAALLPPESAPRTLTLSLDPQSHYRLSTPGDSGTITLSAPPVTFAWWAAQNSVGAASADDDSDGLSNFLEYILGTDPRATTAAVTRPVVITAGLDRFAQIRIQRSLLRPGVTWILQRSSDAANWQNASAAAVIDTASELVVRDSLPLGVGEVRHLRLLFSETGGALTTATASVISATSLVPGNLIQTYTGRPLSPSIMATPTDLSYRLSYRLEGSKVAPTSAAPVNAGRYLVTITTDDPRVSPEQATTVNFEITKAPLRADGPILSRLVGGSNPPLLPIYSGFVNGETASTLDRPPVATTKATPKSAAGTYSVTLKAGTDNNYTISLGSPGTITVVGFGGDHEALLVDASGTPRGKLTLTVPANALTYTGTLNLASEPASLSIRGDLSASDGASATGAWSRAANPARAISALSLGFELTGDTLDGELSVNNSPALSIGSGSRLFVQPVVAGKKQNAPWTGLHTLVLRDPTPLAPPDLTTGSSLPAPNSSLPLGAGHASASIASTGLMTLKGKLADGTTLTGTAAADASGRYRIYARPYAKRLGSFLAGELPLVAHPDQTRFANRFHVPEGEATFAWAKASSPAKPLDPAYRSGFAAELIATLDPWIPPATKSTVINGVTLPAGTLAQRLDLSTDPLSPASLAVAFGPDNLDLGASADRLPALLGLSTQGVFTVAAPVTTPLNASAFSLKVTPATGAFSGSFTLSDVRPPASKLTLRKVPFSGTLRQAPDGDTTLGAGFFLLPDFDKAAEQPSAELILSR